MEFSFLNDRHTQLSACNTFQPPSAQFTYFSELPTELRLRIWELALPRQRLLTLDIVAGRSEPTSTQRQRSEALYQTRDARGNVVSGADYVLRMRSTGYLSPLVRVNSDANRAVSGFYRVHMPVRGRRDLSDDSGATLCLRFCPETDTINLHVDRDGHDASFADVVHDAAACDPMGKGILHMAIGGYSMPSEIRLPLDPISVHIRAQNALISTLNNLHSVTLIDIVRGSARRMFSSLQEYDVRFNRSMPLWSTAASFSAPQTDPRPIEHDLDLVCLGWDPRAIIRAWQTLETAFGVSPTPAERMRVLVAALPVAGPEPWEIVNREDVCRFRAQEEAAWARNFEEGRVYNRYGYANPDTEESLLRARNLNAVGFWVFPLEAFGDVPMVRSAMMAGPEVTTTLFSSEARNEVRG
ncbi:hypothetical protein SLS53_007514 [Cytospora paraplurivora]|uniref:2EXR domain-containing protein n=1 Tax=Cytospora paraplurivora TaxID=2898453 RepID=A0AAN9U0N7_9PEZI